MLRLLPHPLLLSPSGPELSPSHSSLHIYTGGANADVGTVLQLCTLLQATQRDGPDRDSDLPFLSMWSHACTHPRMLVRTHVKVLVRTNVRCTPSAFVVATSEED
jgi:hypothetical protein